MGLPHSGELSDAMMLAIELAGILAPNKMEIFFIKGSARYKDDLVIIIDEIDTNIAVLWWKFKQWSSPYEVSADSISQDGFVMLDVEHYKGYKYMVTSVLDHRPHAKATSFGTNPEHRFGTHAECARDVAYGGDSTTSKIVI